MSDETEFVCSFPKNSREIVRATLGTFHGRRIADLRVYVEDENGGGRKPTRKGLALRVESLPELRFAVDELIRASEIAA